MTQVMAVYLGKKDSKYAVSVKSNNVSFTGTGFIKLFDSEEDAKTFVAAMNSQNLQQPKMDMFQNSGVSNTIKK